MKKYKGNDRDSSEIHGQDKVGSSQNKGSLDLRPEDKDKNDELEALERSEKERQQFQKFNDTLKALGCNESLSDSTDMNTSNDSISYSNESISYSNDSIAYSKSSTFNKEQSLNKKTSIQMITISGKTCKYADIHIGKQ